MVRRSTNGINLHRSGYALSSGASGGQNNGIALKNTSPISELLVVWQFQGDPNNGGSTFNLSQQQKITLTGVVTTFPIVSTDPPPPGQVGNFTSATAFTPSWSWYESSPISNFWPAQFPFAVLMPGWALCIQNNAVLSTPPQFGFWWEAVTPSDFELRFGGSLVDPEI